MPRPLEKRERSLGVQLSIRGERADSPKRAVIRKPYPPGQHGKKFRKKSEFGLQLAEKQKIRFSYGLTDKQLKRIFKEGAGRAESAIQVITEKLESRLDNVVMRLGFAPSRSIARQLVSHGHILVNGKEVRTPSYEVSPEEVIAIAPSSRTHPVFEDLRERLKNYDPPVWLALDKEKLEGKVESLPRDVDFPFDINLVVDYYAKK